MVLSAQLAEVALFNLKTISLDCAIPAMAIAAHDFEQFKSGSGESQISSVIKKLKEMTMGCIEAADAVELEEDVRYRDDDDKQAILEAYEGLCVIHTSVINRLIEKTQLATEHLPLTAVTDALSELDDALNRYIFPLSVLCEGYTSKILKCEAKLKMDKKLVEAIDAWKGTITID